jgi:hypothetical protein
MARLFAPFADTAFRIALLGLISGGAALVLVPFVYVRTPYNDNREFPVDQPVQFDHRHHVKDDGIDCRFCHSAVEKTAYAGIPSTELCMGCHNEVWQKSALLEPVRRSYFSGQPLPWNRVHKLPDFVYFNHAIHVNKGVGCVTCHGRVDQMPLDYQVAPLTMGWCLDCHRNPAPNLRPLDQITNMAWEPPSDPRFATELAQALGVRSLTYCTACHR